MSRSGQKSTVKRPGSPSGQNLGNLGRPDPVRAKIHRKSKKLSGLAPRKIGILGSALYRDIQGSWCNRSDYWARAQLRALTMKILSEGKRLFAVFTIPYNKDTKGTIQK